MLNPNNYLFNIANGKYSIVAERIPSNSARGEIQYLECRLDAINSYLGF